MLKKLMVGGNTPAVVWDDAALSILRVFAGLAMAFGHGLKKVPPSERFVTGITEMGFPTPEAFAWAAGLSEFAGGILLALGLLTRPSALAIAGTMVVAAFVGHAGDSFGDREPALMYLAVMLVFVAAGSGRFGVDRFIRGGK